MSRKMLGGRTRLTTCGAVVVTASMAVGLLATSASAAPSIGNLSGATVGPLSGGVGVVTLTGSDLDEVTRVWFGATSVSRFVREGDTKIHVTPPAARAAGKVDVTVGDSQGEATPDDASDDYEYTAAPVLDKVEAVAIAPSTVKNHLEISGSQLKGASLVLVGDIAVKVLPTLNPATATTLRVKAPTVKGGAYRVAVVTPQGIGSLDNAHGAAPAITKVFVPGKTATGAATQVLALRGSDLGGDVVHLAGSGFTGLKSVSFGKAQSTSVVVESDTLARVVVPAKSAGDVYAATAPNTLKVKVVAENAFGTGTAGPQFQYDAKPTVTALDTTASLATSATNTVTITGTNLTGATVRFGTVAGVVDRAKSSATTLVAAAPRRGTQPATVDLTVTTVAGEAKLVGRWTFAATNPTAKTPWPVVVVTPTPTPSETPTSTPTPTPSETPTEEPTPTPSETPADESRR